MGLRVYSGRSKVSNHQRLLCIAERACETQQLKGEVGQQEDHLEIKNILVDQRIQ